MASVFDRREWLARAGAGLAGVVLAVPTLGADSKESEAGEKNVAAVEDLMREHGVLRRALLVYSEAASRLSHGNGNVAFDELGRTAALFRSFGEDYHERSLEEKHVFPPLIQAGGEPAALARTLIVQHDRGRQVTDYVTSVAKKGGLGTSHSQDFSGTLLSFVRMYQHHAAIEDTIVFPAWKQVISSAQYRELTEQFEALEHKMFGKDGFEDALKRIATIEEAFGLSDLGALTPPPPPKLA